jgi:hypothetical protein
MASIGNQAAPFRGEIFVETRPGKNLSSSVRSGIFLLRKQMCDMSLLTELEY